MMGRNLPVIAGVEITTDEHGRFNLNALHRASGLGESKKPSEWLRTQQAGDLIGALNSQSGDSHFGPINTIRGGNSPGTFAAEQLAVAYANWISPPFYLKVIQTFLDHKKGAAQQPAIPQSFADALRLAAEQAEAIEEMKPKAMFHDQVAVAQGAISLSEAAKIIGTGRTRLCAFMRRNGWLRRNNEPYQDKIESGDMDVKLGSWDHPDYGIQRSVTALVTGKGLTKLQRLWSEGQSKAA